jgi:hypothetical protein
MNATRIGVLSLIFACVSLNHAGAQPANQWPVDATLSYFFCERGECNVSHPVISGTINFGPHTSSRRVFNTTQVTFGPFHLTRGVDFTGTTKAPPSTFHVEVWARSPAFYGPDEKFAGANLQLRRIGSASATLSGNDDATQDLYVSATLPGMVNALQFRASVNSTLVTRSFPPSCSDLPPLYGSASLDDACMQAGVNPLAVINPHITPLAIIYEPPGNCSYAKLTQTDVVGTTISATQTSSTTTNTLVDPDVIAAATGAQTQNFTSQESAPNTRIAKLTLSQSQTYGTILSSGLPDSCKQPGATVPPRANSGPGNGDIFLLLINQALIYWDQGGLSNFLFGPPLGSKLLVVPAWELKTPEGLQQLQTENNVTLTTAEAAAILALDPLVLSPAQALRAGIGPFSYPALPKRFIPVNQPSISLPSGLSAAFSVTRDEVVSADNQSCALSNTVSNTDSVGLTEKLAVEGGETILGFLIGEAVGGGKLADAIGGAIKNIGPAQILGETKTTVTVGLNSCKGLTHLSQNTDTQDAFLKDTNIGINVAPYYDAFFGTIAYVPLPLGMGVLTDAEALNANLPHFVFNVQARLNSDIRLAFPSDLSPKLTALGHASLKPAPAGNYVVARNTGKGLPTGLQLDAQGNLTGRLGTPQNTQTLYYVQDTLGKTVALLWVDVTTTF